MSGEGVLPPDMSQDQDTRGQDPWRHLTATELKARTVTFSAEKEVKLVDYIKCLELHGIRPEEILSIQVSTAGQCRLTFVCEQLAQQVCANGFIFKRNHIFPISVVNRNLQLHIHDVPIWVADAAIVAALSPYGDVQGHIRHGRITVREGVHVASGVRFGTFKPSAGKTIPSYIRTRDGKGTFRVYHQGQTPTCRICDSTEHIAKHCTTKQGNLSERGMRPVQGTTVSPPQNTAGSSTAQQQQEQNPTVSADNTTKNATQRTAGAWNGQSTLSRPHKEVPGRSTDENQAASACSSESEELPLPDFNQSPPRPFNLQQDSQTQLQLPANAIGDLAQSMSQGRLTKSGSDSDTDSDGFQVHSSKRPRSSVTPERPCGATANAPRNKKKLKKGKPRQS